MYGFKKRISAFHGKDDRKGSVSGLYGYDADCGAEVGNGNRRGDTKLQMIYFRGEKGPESIGENAIPGAEEAEELVIAAQKGSSAEAYAEENGLPFEENEPEE